MSKRKEEFLNLGAIFKATRKFNGLHQTEASAILGITQGTISKIESSLMQPELTLWFRFLKAFSIKDPYCFTTDILEFDESAFKRLHKEKSQLAPMIDFKNERWICSVNDILPLYMHVVSCKEDALKNYLSNNQIHAELFRINNHPLTLSFLESFFEFLNEVKITNETIAFVVPGFDRNKLFCEDKSIQQMSA